ncbi:hypothetical protein [Leptolyngbya sp. O-77]|nr:hypothetical protein [Leptolyngbya sp. O-77]
MLRETAANPITSVLNTGVNRAGRSPNQSPNSALAHSPLSST